MLKLQVIIGSTRPERHADTVARWLIPVAQARGHFEVETIDLRQWSLPFFQETLATVGDWNDPSYSDPLVKRWNLKIKEADAYLFITPEYNHSVPGVLKNAIDTVFFSWGFRHKPFAVAAYSLGVGAGVRAVEHLNQIMLEHEAVAVRTPTLIPFVGNAFGAEGKPTSPMPDIMLGIVLDDLAWLGRALQRARAEGQLPPPGVRQRAATAAAARR